MEKQSNVSPETGEITGADRLKDDSYGFAPGVHGTAGQRAALFASLAAAQGELGNVQKDATNPHFKSRYATLAAVLDVVRPVSSRHGLALVQMVDGEDLVSIVGHGDGASLVSRMRLLIAKSDMQGVGSAVQYARRYMSSALFGVAQEDDDGNAASTKPGSSLGNGASPALSPAANVTEMPKISDASHIEVVASIQRIQAMGNDREKLAIAASFAPRKYAGHALIKVITAIEVATRQCQQDKAA